MKRAGDESATPFTNITREHLKSLLPQAGLKTIDSSNHWKAPDVGEEEVNVELRREKPSLSFDDCVNQGGRIVDMHKTVRDTYALHSESFTWSGAFTTFR